MWLSFDDHKLLPSPVDEDDRTNLDEARRAKAGGTRNTDGFYVALLRRRSR